MPKIWPNYQLASGNDNAAGLTAFPSITDANSIPFVMPQGKGSRTRGSKRVRLNGTEGQVGFNSFTLLFTAMTLAQYALLLSTYEGLVTVKISLSSTSFANYNAVLVVPDETDLTYVRVMNYYKWNGYQGGGYRDVSLLLRKLEAL